MKSFSLLPLIAACVFSIGKSQGAVQEYLVAAHAVAPSDIAKLRIPPQKLKQIAIAQTNFTSTMRAIDPDRLKVLIKDQANWKQVDAPATRDRDNIMISTLPNQLSLTFFAATNRQMLSKTNRLALPFVIAGVNNGQDISKYVVELYAEPSPAHWSADRNQYETDVYVAMRRPGEVTPSTLPTPLSVTLRGQGDAVAEPRELTFTKSVQFAASHVSFPRADGDPRIDALPFTEKAPLLLPVRKVSALQVTASPKTILGYGLGTTTLTVTRVDASGSPLEEGPALTVRPASDAARLSEAAIKAGQSSTTVKLRSSGSGSDNIQLSAGPVVGAAIIQYKQPWTFLLAAVLGSLLGASARVLKQNVRKSDQLRKIVLEGCVAGLLTTAAVCAGVAFNVFPAAVQETELFAFIISAVVAMIGVKSVDWMRKLAPTPAPAPEETVHKLNR